MLWHYWRARHLTFRNRDELEAYQQKRLAHLSAKCYRKPLLSAIYQSAII